MRCIPVVDLTVLLCSCLNFRSHSHHPQHQFCTALHLQCKMHQFNKHVYHNARRNIVALSGKWFAGVCVFSYHRGRAGGPLRSQSITAMTTKTGQSNGAARSTQAPRKYNFRVLICQGELSTWIIAIAGSRPFRVSGGDRLQSALFV